MMKVLLCVAIEYLYSEYSTEYSTYTSIVPVPF